MYVCEYEDYPIDCLEIPAIDCIRGQKVVAVVNIRQYTILTFSVSGCIGTWLVYLTVRKQLISTSGSSLRSSVHSSQIRSAGVQAVWYSLAYLNGLIWFVIAQVTQNVTTVDQQHSNTVLFAMTAAVYFFAPLQGLLNMIIYIRPRYMGWKTYAPSNSKIWALNQVLQGCDVARSRRFERPATRIQLEDGEPAHRNIENCLDDVPESLSSTGEQVVCTSSISAEELSLDARPSQSILSVEHTGA